MNGATIIQTTTFRNNLADVLRELEKTKYLLIAKKNKLVSAVVDLDFFEDLLALANPKYMASIKKAREEYKRGEVYTFKEVFGKV